MNPSKPSLAAIALAFALNLPASAATNAPSNPIILTPFEYPKNTVFENETPDDPTDDIRLPHQGIVIELVWVDNSDNEENFEVELYLGSTEPGNRVALFSQIVPNQTIFTVRSGNPQPGTILNFRVRALNSTDGNSEWSEFTEAALPLTDVAIQSLTYKSGIVGVPMQDHTPVSVKALVHEASFIPPGIELDERTGTFSGTPTRAGVFRSVLRSTDGISQASTIVTFRFRNPDPAVRLNTPLTDRFLPPDAPQTTIDLHNHFTSPDVTAFRLDTNRGDIDIILYPEVTPLTVANFRNYTARGDIDGTIFHRSVALDTAGIDIIQSGWFKPGENGGYQSVTRDAGIPNEPAFPNVRGTIATAKSASQPDSATSQFYFNVSDSPALDTPANNGGFTVFGRATTPSLAVIDDIHNRPTGAYQLALDTNTTSITNWPTNGILADDAVPGPDDLVQILTVTELQQFVSFSIENQTGDAAVATLDRSSLTLTPSQQGATSLTLNATDLDGNSVTSTFDVFVMPEINPVASLVEVGDDDHLAITFTHSDGDGAPSYEVQESTGLTSWTTIWKTADGNSHPTVVSTTPSGDSSTTLTVRTPTPRTQESTRHLRVKVTFATPPAP
ncbi:MAG: peptidylprolyl isomerase [Verrucomicrobiales bacterium]|nr:peptidylprolyl isomerase [Verrucomicrobiales bacterium]